MHRLISEMKLEMLKDTIGPLSPAQQIECLNNWSVTGRTAMGRYAERGRPMSETCLVFQLLVETKADPSVRCSKGLTPLHLASMRVDLSGSLAKPDPQSRIVSFLLALHDEGVDIAVEARESIDDCTALLVALASSAKSGKATEGLIRRRINIDSRCYPRKDDESTLFGTCDQGETPLMMAVRMEDERALRLLLEVGADVNQQSDRGYTAAHVACINGESSALEILFEHPHLELRSASSLLKP